MLLVFLLGKWEFVDTIVGEIEFVDEGQQVIIEPRTHVHHFTFQKENDSVFVTGTAMNWPPYDCILIPKNDGILEIKYFNYMSNRTYDQVFQKK